MSDPSALTTIEEPIAAFDAREPLEQTFVKGRTPEPAQPHSEPDKPIERPKANDAQSGRERLQRQPKNLERSMAKAKAAGDDVQLLERQLSIVRTRLEVARSPEDLEALQVALERIAEDLRAP